MADDRLFTPMFRGARRPNRDLTPVNPRPHKSDYPILSGGQPALLPFGLVRGLGVARPYVLAHLASRCLWALAAKHGLHRIISPVSLRHFFR